MCQPPSEVARSRARQVLEFLREFQRLKKPPVRNVVEYSWHFSLDRLPRHAHVEVGQVVEADSREDAGAVDGLILRVRRPALTPCPPPPAELREWILSGWQQFDAKPEFHDARNVVIDGTSRTVRFEEDERRVRARQEWTAARDAWVIAETPARQVEDLYQRLYALFGQVERESENVQLFLGDGMLRAKDTNGLVHHPVLLQKVELHFDPSVPAFSLSETDDPPELAMTLISSVVGSQGESLADTSQLANRQVELAQNPRVHPLGGNETKGFLQRLLNGVFAKGRFLEHADELESIPAQVTLRRDPLLFLASRTGSFTTAIEAAQKRLRQTDSAQVPRAIASLVGVDLADTIEPGTSAPATRPHPRIPASGECDLLLTRPANDEQEQIIRQLDRTGMVLVQGPPGTGKTHTIANLVGHTLAQGKTILITSHTAKALRVVREKIVKDLQPLCVSLLETDAASRQELRQAVDAIGQQLGTTSQDQLDAQAHRLRSEREAIILRLNEAAEALRRAVRDEYVDIIVGGEGTKPAEAARTLHEWRNEHSWLPGPIENGAVLPLSLEAVLDLYRTNALITPADEQDLAAGLPDIGRLLGVPQFEKLVARIRILQGAKLDEDEHLWPTPTTVKREAIQQICSRISSEVERLDREPAWFRECVEAGMHGPAAASHWLGLIECINAAGKVSAEAKSHALARQIHDLPTGWDLLQLREVSEAIERHMRTGGKLGMLTRLLHPDWQRLLDERVGGRQLQDVADFHALAKLAAAASQRQQLCSRWTHQLSGLGEEGSLPSTSSPEQYCQQFIPRFQEGLAWYESVGREIERGLGNIGLPLSEYVNRQPAHPGPQPTLARWQLAFRQLLPLLSRRLELLELREGKQQLKAVVDYLKPLVAGPSIASIAQDLTQAVSRCDIGVYSAAIKRLQQLVSLREPFRRRTEALAAIKKVAPHWDDAIARREPPHDRETPPGDVSPAWLFRQWTQELERRSNTDIDALQRQVNELSGQLRDVTARYVVKSTWAEQFRNRYSLPQRQALQGWLQTISKPGFESGVRSAKLKAQARDLLTKCRSAVPVWIMPLSRVAESFDFASEQFDVVIVDEASQCDVLGLLPIMIAKEVVIVGDHEQVTPAAVGQNLGRVQSLIEDYLTEIPNRQLYDGRTSIYHLAQTCFGATIRLVEHFRCVPEIIQFSNHLCYAGDIKPLRESQCVRTRPFLVCHRVADGTASNKTNMVEAMEVASLLVATTEQPEYAGLTMGVIGLVGDEQAASIDVLLRRHLPETEYSARRIICGNAAEFQGDERHVVFLSMVDSSDGTPLPMRREPAFRQRFNVAASRAQDQLWVVHSLNPDTELQPGDLRLRLIQHAQDPSALTRQLCIANQQAQSEFERQVIRRLTNQTFRLATQWQVGAFSIDIVVFGEGGRKVAIECDGDRYHTSENLEADYRRQLMLERLGWRFIRIRSSRFFRDPDATMSRVFERLEQLEIRAIGPVNEAAPEQARDAELQERVLRRAAELRREWREQEERQEPTAATSSTPRRGRGRSAPKADRPPERPKATPEPKSQQDLPLDAEEVRDVPAAAVVGMTGQQKNAPREPTAATPPASAERREPWQMTLTEWKRRREELRSIGDQEGLRAISGLGTEIAHRAKVEQAVKEGKSVPAEVLVDYPDLRHSAPNDD